jgi:S1-C subfamily serine protease
VIGIDTSRSHYFVITNRHVVVHEVEEDHELSFEIEFENQARFDGLLDFYSRRHDLALLAVLGTPMWAQPVAMRTVDGLTVGEPVYAVGSPEGLSHTFTSGVISAFREGFIQTDAAIHSGSSGGPLFESHGLLCGVVTATHESKDFSFALYADAVFDMLLEREQAVASAQLAD